MTWACAICWPATTTTPPTPSPVRHAAAPAERLYQANLAMAVGMGGRYDQSLVLYQDVLPAAEAHYNLALLCQARGDTTRADQEFATAKSMGFGPPKPALPQP